MRLQVHQDLLGRAGLYHPLGTVSGPYNSPQVLHLKSDCTFNKDPIYNCYSVGAVANIQNLWSKSGFPGGCGVTPAVVTG